MVDRVINYSPASTYSTSPEVLGDGAGDGAVSTGDLRAVDHSGFILKTYGNHIPLTTGANGVDRARGILHSHRCCLAGTIFASEKVPDDHRKRCAVVDDSAFATERCLRDQAAGSGRDPLS